MALTEEQKKQLYKFIVKERHYTMNDIYAFMPDVDHRYLRDVLKSITTFIRFDRCPYCNTSILVTYSNRQQVYCCPEHKKAFNNRNRPKTRIVVCERCGKEFTTYSFRKTRYCSPYCSARHRADLMKEKKDQNK